MKLQAAAVLLGALMYTTQVQSADSGPMRQVQTISLPNVEGRIDHMGVDIQGQRLFVAALGNNSVEVLDVRSGKRLTRITGLREPQGISFVPEENRFFVANHDDGTCRVFDGSSYKPLLTIDFPSDADNVRYDAVRTLIYVGYGEGGLGILDASAGKMVGNIELPAHPESFRLEQSGPRIFVNLPDANHTIAVVDRTKGSVVATWQLGPAANFPMALDEDTHRLFVVTRTPARMVVLDTTSGKEVAGYAAVGDADDVFYDPLRKRIYISGGEGFIDVFERFGPDKYRKLREVATAAGARTSLFVPGLNRLFLAVPHRGNQQAEIRVFEPLR